MNSEEKELAELMPQMRQLHKVRELLGTPTATETGVSIIQPDLMDLHGDTWKNVYVFDGKWKSFILNIKEAMTGELYFFVADRATGKEKEFLF